MAEPYRFDGVTARELCQLLGLPRVELAESAASTLDIAHRLGNEGADAGTLIVVERQTAGVECRKDRGILDEAPKAYKDIGRVMDAQRDLVEIVAELKQVVCVKG